MNLVAIPPPPSFAPLLLFLYTVLLIKFNQFLHRVKYSSELDLKVSASFKPNCMKKGLFIHEFPFGGYL
jgi:hypothetical protein